VRAESSALLTPDGISGLQTSLLEDQKEEGYSGNLTVSLEGSGVLVTWPAMRQQSGSGTSFSDKANGA
jgi:hypothetical protein